MRAKKTLSTMVAMALLLGMLQIGALAAPADQLAGQWYQGAMTAALERGIIGGDENGDLHPTRAITRGEMAVMLDRIMDYRLKAENKFSDLTAGAYYTDAILGASAAGILKGDDRGNVNPNAGITRQETAVMLGRVMGIEDQTAPSGQFADQANIATWAVDAVNAIKAAGYMGAQENSFRPLDAITRAEVATVLSNIFAGYFNKAETYSADVNGSAVINAAGATLKNMKVSGDLIIAEGVGDGNVYLDGVTIGGRLLVRGGGVNSIYIKGASQIGNVIIARIDGEVRVVVEGGAQVEVIVVDDGSDDVKIEGTVGTLQVDSANITVEVTGKVNTVVVDGENANLKVSGTVDKVETTGNATGAVVETTSTGKITKVDASGAGTQVGGAGKVEHVTAKANDVKVDTSSTKVEAAPGTTGVTAGDKSVAGGSSATTPGASTGGSSGAYVPPSPVGPTWTADVSEQLATKSTTFFKNYENKYTEVPNVAVEDNEYYVEVASNIGEAQSITVAGQLLKFKENIKVSIGNNSFIDQPAYKIEGNKLFIALPILNLESSPKGTVKIGINGFTGTIKTFYGNETALKITNVKALGGNAGYLNEAKLSEDANRKQVVTHERQDGTAYVVWLLSDGTNQTAPGSKAFSKKVFSDGQSTAYGIMTIEDEGKGYSTGMYNYYFNGEFTLDSILKNRDIDYKIGIPGVGAINFTVKFIETVKTVEP